MRRILFAVALAAAPAALVACGQSAAAPRAGGFTCPMHPGYHADHPGSCPICGMKLVLEAHADGTAPAARRERTIRFYRSPMDPTQTSPVPTKDAMGMDYLPVYDDEIPAHPGEVRLAPDRARLLGLRTVPVERAAIGAAIRTSGRVAFDETRLARVQPRFEGFIETLEADYTGKLVHKGDPLATVYSPELVATEEEYLLARAGQRTLAASGLPDAAASARERLALLGVAPSDLRAIERTGRPLRALHLVAPRTGYLVTKNAVAGGRVAPDQPLFEIADLSKVWVLADVYERELPGLAVGQPAEITLAYWPGRLWRGRVSFISPTVDDKTRTVRVRIALDNPNGELKPEMFADVVLRGADRKALVVPDDAVIDAGARKLVYVASGDSFTPRPVEIGARDGGRVEIRAGLAEGDRVARGAGFLLDSESQLRAAAPGAGPEGGR